MPCCWYQRILGWFATRSLVARLVVWYIILNGCLVLVIMPSMVYKSTLQPVIEVYGVPSAITSGTTNSTKYSLDKQGSETTRPKLDRDITIHIIIVADLEYQDMYRLQLETIRCYAEAKGLHLIHPSEIDMTICHRNFFRLFNGNVFFQRHCLVANIMEKYPEEDFFIVMDADTIAFDLDVNFPQEYLKHDLVFYERWWNGEVMITMGARNKPSVREWIMTWSLEPSEPYVPVTPWTFYSYDNGILHVLLMKWFIFHKKSLKEPVVSALSQKQKFAFTCMQKFSALRDTVTNLDPYWDFVRCARIALGMQSNVPGEFKIYPDEKSQQVMDPVLLDFRKNGLELESMGVKLKMMPRFHGIAVDINALEWASRGDVIFLHGVKSDESVLEFWDDTFGKDKMLHIYPLCKLKGGNKL